MIDFVSGQKRRMRVPGRPPFAEYEAQHAKPAGHDGMRVSEEIGKDETNQTRNYLTPPMGKLAIMCCSGEPNHAAHIKRNAILSEDGKVILFVTREQLTEMLFIKERGEDPSDLIMDLVERFYLQHE